MPTPNSDDDAAANRIRHGDGSYVEGPVTATCPVWYSLIGKVNTALLNTDEQNLYNGLRALTAPP